MERAPRNESEQNEESFSRKEKFEMLLGLFGTDEARERFLSICKDYYGSRKEELPPTVDAENYRAQNNKRYSPPRRAELHNLIMETLTMLATQSKNLTPLQKSVLNEFHSREEIAGAVKEYVLAEEKREEDDEDEVERKRSSMSGPAYFHSLGKEH